MQILGVVVQYDEHLSKTMGQWHAKKAFFRGL
jgi:hypothetical protein